MSRSGSRWVSWGLFATVFAVYLVSPAGSISDSAYSVLVSESLLTRGSFELDGLVSLPGAAVPFQLEVVDGHLFYRFPPGGSVLTVPILAAMKPFGLTPLGPDGTYDARGEKRIQKRAAAFLMALFALMVWRTARLRLGDGWSLVVVVAVALGSQIWSTASRALWSQTWSVLLLGIAAYLLLGAAAESKRLDVYLLGSLLAWAFFCRPTSAIPLVAVTGYVALLHRDRLAALLATLAAWLGLFAVYSWVQFGSLLPSYYQPGRLGGGPVATALLGNLVAPSRGLLVFVPQLLFVAYLLVRYRAFLRERPLALLAASIVTLHWLLISTYFHWWGGHSYGPRLMTDAVPWLTLLAICGLAAWREARRTSHRGPVAAAGRLEGAVGALLLLSGIAIHAVGATSREAGHCWNRYPADVDAQPSRVWEWSDPQFLAWLRPRCDAHENTAGAQAPWRRSGSAVRYSISTYFEG